MADQVDENVDINDEQDVFNIADLLLQDTVAEPPQYNSYAGQNESDDDNDSDSDITEVDANGERPNEGGNNWVNPLASLQAYSIEPQQVLNEILQRSHHQTKTLQKTEFIEKVAEGSVSNVNNFRDALTTEVVCKDEVVDDQVSLEKGESSTANGDMQIAYENVCVKMEETEKEDEVLTVSESSEEEETAEPSKTQYKIVSLDPTIFPDAKVKEMPVSNQNNPEQGRRSKSKLRAKPRRLSSMVLPEEPLAKRQRRSPRISVPVRDDLELELSTDSEDLLPKRPRKAQRRSRQLKKTKKRGRPAKSQVLAQMRKPRAVIVKEEHVADEEPPEMETMDMGYYQPVGLSEDNERPTRRSSKKLKGTHIMKYKSYKCFVCDDSKDLGSQASFVKHWATSHFVVAEDAANLHCPDCPAKYSVSLTRFHRPTDVLQYVAFYFNHRLKKHNMVAPDYIEEMRCQEPNCHYIAYTSYCLSRHIEEGKHRLRPLAMNRLPPPDGSGRREQLGEMYKLPGNKYSLIFKSFKCYVCGDDTDYETTSRLLDHWRNSHFEFSEREAVIACSFCDAKYRVPMKRFHRQTDTMQYIAYYFSHLVKRHNFTVPEYIEQLSCGQPGCKFITYTKQLLERHLQEVKHVTLSRTPALADGDASPSQSARSPYLKFREFRCFQCKGSDGGDLGPFENGATLAEHWRNKHFHRDGERLILQCECCAVLYTIHASRYARNADVLAMIARFFTHQVKKHKLTPPPYIEELHCKVPGCDYKCFTAQIMDGHRNSKREPAHMGMTSTDNLTSLSIRKTKGRGITSSSAPDKEREYASTAPRNEEITKAVISPGDDLLLSKESESNEAIAEVSKDSDDNGNFKSPPSTSLDLYLGDSIVDLEKTNMDALDSKAKSLLNFTEIKCFVCNDDKVYENQNKFVNHWRDEHFVIGDYEVYIDCPKCHARIGLNKPLWHRDHDIGRCVASYLTHLIKYHQFTVPSYVKELTCPEPGCNYKTLTVKHYQFHVRHTKHHKLERAKRFASGVNPDSLISEHFRKGYPFRVTDNGLTFKEFQCYLCQDGVIYPTTLEYEQHWRQCHVKEMNGKKDVVSCHICNTTFASHLYPSIAFLFCHLVKKHKFVAPWYIEEFKCDIAECNYTTYTRALFEKHKAGQRHNSGSGNFLYYLNFLEYRCLLCHDSSESFPSKRLFENHLMEVHVRKDESGDFLECPDCHHHFILHYCKKPQLNYEKADPSRTLCALFNHMVVKHNYAIPSFVKEFKCSHEGCDFVTVRKYTLSRHELSHVPDQQCYQCGMFFSKTRIEKHVRNCLRGESTSSSSGASYKSYPCPECGVSMIQRKTLRKHMMESHNMNKDDAMNLVKKLAPKMKSRNVRASESGMAYNCGDCGKILLEKKSMKRHIQSAHGRIVENGDLQCIPYDYKAPEGPKNYQCTLCGVQMNLFKSVKRHMLKQHGVKAAPGDLASTYIRVDPVIFEEADRHYPVSVYQQEALEHEFISEDETGPAPDANNFDVEPCNNFNKSPQPVPDDRNMHQTSTQNITVPSQPLNVPQHMSHQSSMPQMFPKTMINTRIPQPSNQALDFRMRFSELEAGEIPTSVIQQNPRIELINPHLPTSHSNMHSAMVHDPTGLQMQHEIPTLISERDNLLNQRLNGTPNTMLTVPPANQDAGMAQMLPMDYRVASGNEVLLQRIPSWPNQSQT